MGEHPNLGSAGALPLAIRGVADLKTRTSSHALTYRICLF